MGTPVPALRYRVESRPSQHEFDITLTLEGLAGPGPVHLATPTWIPGAYGFMKYGRDVFGVTATDPATGVALAVRREGWSGYVVDALSPSMEVHFSVTACDPAWGELAGFLDQHQALFLPTRLLFPPDHAGPCRVQFVLPEGWALHHPAGPEAINTTTFDHTSHLAFLDSPVVLGAFEQRTQTLHGVPFHFVFLDRAIGFEAEVEAFLVDLLRLAETCTELFGTFPFASYTFIYSFDPRFHWGLEHANATTIGLGQDCFIDPKARANGLRVSVHELVHAWNGCRLKPAPMGAPDLLRGGFPDALWVTEGFTRYYEFLLCVRAGLMAPEAFFSNLVNYHRQLCVQPAAGRVSVIDSSHATFLNHNRYPGCSNATIDYYDKGMLIAFVLDVALRTLGTTTLDREFAALYEAFAGQGAGFSHAQARDFLATRTPSIAAALTQATEGVGDCGVREALETLGFALGEASLPTLGVVLAQNLGPTVADVLDTSPASFAGLAPGDDIRSLEGSPFSLKGLRWLLAHQARFSMEVQRGARTLRFDVAPRQRSDWTSLTWQGGPEQRALLRDWLHRPEYEPPFGEPILLDAFDNFHGIHTVL